MAFSRRGFLSLLTWALAVRALPAWAAEAIATVVAIVNGVNATRPGTARGEPVPPNTPIEPGTEIATEPASAVQIAMNDGSVITIGAGVRATIGSGDNVVLLTTGSLRFRTSAGALKEPALATAALQVALHDTAEMIITAGEGVTTCGVVSGRITCSSIKKGTSIEVPAGKSVRWGAGSFGGGVMDVAYVSGDIAVDSGIEAARAAYEEPLVGAPPPVAK